MKKIDLHIHTKFSDGLLSSKEILKLAQERKLDVISITDHDTLDGYKIASKIVGDYNLQLIPGVEISSNYHGKEVHILAYNFDPDNKKLLELLKYIQRGRFLRAKKMVDKLQEMGINIDLNEVRKLTGEKDLIGRPHIARAMVKAGYCVDKQEAFNNFINDNGPAYFAKPTPSPKKIIKTIKKAGGISVLAHPYTLKSDAIIYDLVEMGLQGMEVYYAKTDLDIIAHYERIACEYNLIRTGGSDFHGDEFDIEIFGVFTAPELVMEEIENRMNCQIPAYSN